MDIKYAPTYQTKNTVYLAVHHSGGIGSDPLALSQNLKAADIDRAHAARWYADRLTWSAYVSSLGHNGGYNFFIEKDGTTTQFRAIGEETAAVKGHNYNGETISVCLAGNFTVGIERPTAPQIAALQLLYSSLPLISSWNIVPHRYLQTTECYGNGLADNWARTILFDTQNNKLRTLIALYTKLLDLYRRLKIQAGTFGRALFGGSTGFCGEMDVRG